MRRMHTDVLSYICINQNQYYTTCSTPAATVNVECSAIGWILYSDSFTSDLFPWILKCGGQVWLFREES